MNLHELKPAKGATRNNKRLGRGQGSGRGGTSTRGHKGAKSRSGYKRKRNFEGGQMPLQMRLPKVGFKNADKIYYVAVNLARLQEIADKFGTDTITPEFMYEKGLIKKNDQIKVLGNGTLDKKLTVSAHKCSEKAKQTIEGKGGSINLV